MPLSLRWGTVTAVVRRLDGLVRLEVDDTPCIAYPRLTGAVEPGDVVLVNTQARALGLGSGGFDVVHANLTRGIGLDASPGAHVMALPYTPLQHAVTTVEESGLTADDLGGMPVVCLSLHSQLAPALAGLGAGSRVAYVQLGGGALPVSLSDTVRALRARGLLRTAVAVAPCFDGDAHAVTAAGALAWVRAAGYDAAVCGIGPGIVGTGSRLGHGGLAVADAVNAATALGGQAVVAPRVGFGDDRERHRGLSHHTRAALSICARPPRVAWPAGLERPQGVHVEPVDVPDWRAACAGFDLSHMGRGPDDEPWFFAAAFAAGRLARALVVGDES